MKLSQEAPVCCFEYVDGGQFYVKQLMRGFARIITRKNQNGIMSIQEGRFRDGEMYEFGRFLNMWPNSAYYNFEQSYTGWFPDIANSGQGVATVDSNQIYSGEWKASAGFPNGGMDLLYAGNLIEYKVTSLESRYGPQ